MRSSSFIVNVAFFALLFLFSNNGVSAIGASLPASSFIVYPIPPGANNSLAVPVYPISTNLTITLDPLGLELLDNITIYPIALDTSVITSQFPISYHNLLVPFFSIPFNVLEAILPASGYNVTYDVISGGGSALKGSSSSLVFVSSDANSSTVLVTTDSSDGENTWSRHVSRNASTYVASSILGFLFLTILILFICSYNDPTFMSSSSYPVVTTTTERPLLKKKKSHKKKKHHHRHDKHSNKKKKKARDTDSDSSSSSSSSSSSDDDNDSRV